MTLNQLFTAFLVVLFSFGSISVNAHNGKDKTVAEEAKEDYRSFKYDMKQKLKRLDKKMAELSDEASEKTDETKEYMSKKMTEMNEARKDLADKLEKFGKDTKKTFVSIKSEIEEDYEKLEHEVYHLFN